MASATFGRNTTAEGDYSSVVNIVNWIVGVAFTFCVAAKFTTKLVRKTRLGADDFVISIALVLSIGVVACFTTAAINGLGRKTADLTASELVAFQKSIYSADLLYVTGLFFSKFSMLTILELLIMIKKHDRLLWAMRGLLLVWVVTSVFTSAFQCPVPNTWTVLADKCVNQTAFWEYFEASNLCLELAIALIPIIVLSGVQLSRARMTTVSIVFGLRLFIIAPIAANLYYRSKISPGSEEQTFSLWPVAICRTITAGLSIIFACTPYMRPFFTSLDHGMTRVDEERRKESLTVYMKHKKHGKFGYRSSASVINSRNSRNSRALQRSQEKTSSEAEIAQPESGPHSSITQTSTVEIHTENRHSDDDDPRTSTAYLDSVKQTDI